MSDLQPIQEVLIIEIIEKCTPCRIYMEKQLSQTIAVFSVQVLADFSLNSQCLPSMLDFFFLQFHSKHNEEAGKAKWNLHVWKC